MKKMTNQQIVGSCIFLLVLVMGLIMNGMYQIGYHAGLIDICEPLDAGINLDGNILCYNETLRQEASEIHYNIPTDMEEIVWH